jgi:hypothetical protein
MKWSVPAWVAAAGLVLSAGCTSSEAPLADALCATMRQLQSALLFNPGRATSPVTELQTLEQTLEQEAARYEGAGQSTVAAKVRAVADAVGTYSTLWATDNSEAPSAALLEAAAALSRAIQQLPVSCGSFTPIGT